MTTPAENRTDSALRALLDRSASLVLVADSAGQLTYANARVAALGYAVDDVVGKNVVDFLHPDDRDADMSSYVRAVDKAQEREPAEVRIRRADGSYALYEIMLTNLLDDEDVRGMVIEGRDVGDRYEQQRRYRLLFEQSPVAQVLVPPDRPAMIANEAFARLFGYNRVALLDMHFSEVFGSSDAHAAFIEELLGGPSHESSVTITLRRHDDEAFTAHVTATAVYDQGALDHILASVEDITEAVRQAAELEASEQRLRAIIDNSPDIIGVVREGGLFEQSGRGTGRLGYPAGFVPPGGFRALLHEDDIETALVALQEVWQGTRDHDSPLEVRLRNAAGEYETFELVAQLTGGGALGRSVVVTARNINERRKAKEAFYAAAERLRVTFEHAPLGVSLVSMKGIIIDINAAACHMSGKTREELLGSDAQEVLHPGDRDLAIEYTTRQLAGEEAKAEFRMLRPDGSIVWALSEARLYEPPTGDPFIITMQTDITERKRLEEELAIQATRDPLTGLLNRGAFVTQLELELARRDPPSFALLFIDLDKFKPVNDLLGHSAGDAVLAQVADRLEKHTRRGDVVARLGGDEFVVIYHGRDIKKGVTHAADRLCAAVAEPIVIQGQQVSVGASVGAALARPNESAAELMQRADEASYLAKQSGGSCVVYADPVDVSSTARRRSSA